MSGSVRSGPAHAEQEVGRPFDLARCTELAPARLPRCVTSLLDDLELCSVATVSRGGAALSELRFVATSGRTLGGPF